MPPATYSFIDVVALDDVRGRFADGDAIVILSSDLADVIWANGPGAALLGNANIEAIIGENSGLGFAARRQIMSTRGFPHIGRDRSVTVRLNWGAESQAVGFRASAIVMPDGEDAIMLVAPSDLTAKGRAASAISGFTQPGHLVALVDSRGGVAAATEGFESLGISVQALNDLVRDVSRDPDRVIKKNIPCAGRTLPAGIARLCDEPALHLLMVVDEAAQLHAPPDAKPDAAEIGQRSSLVDTSLVTEAETIAAMHDVSPGDASDGMVLDGAADSASVREAGRPDGLPDEASATAADDFLMPEEDGPPDATTIDFMSGSEQGDAYARQPPLTQQDEIDTGRTTISGIEPDAASVARDDSSAEVEPSALESIAAAPPSLTDQPAETEDIPLVDTQAAPEPAEAMASAGPEIVEAEAAVTPATSTADADRADISTERPAAAVRFTWKTDADGRFTAISPEFVEAVGDAAADVIGRTFEDVSEALGLDPSGDIVGLLDRRDTWSGRQVMWPIAGTDLKVPVDLAALPVYSRDRRFEGFRGFGVARNADVVMDPEGAGLRLDSDGRIEAFSAASAGLIEPAEEISEDASRASDPFEGEVPALSIVPQPERRLSDKIIKLAEHRPTTPERSLSPVEKVAFREIGERLKKAERAERGSSPGGESGDAANENGVERVSAPQGGLGTDGAPADAFVQPADQHSEAQTDFFGATAAEPLPASDESDDERADEATPERDEITADLFEPQTSTDQPELAGGGEKTAEPSALPQDEYEPSDFEGWSELTPPVEEALNETDETLPAEHEAEIGGEVVPYPEPKPAVDSVPAEDGHTAQPDGDPAADDDDLATGGDPSSAAAEDYEPSNHEGWSELTPPVEEAMQVADAAEGDVSEPAAAGRMQDTAILSRLPVPILIHSGDVLHYANEEFLELTGYASVEALADAGGLGALFAEAYQDGPSDANRALRLRTFNGVEFPIEAVLRAVPWQGSRALMLVVRRTGGVEAPLTPPLLEVGERDELKARLAEMRTIIDTATDGVILIDNDGLIRSISRPAEALFGFDSDELDGKPFVSLFAIESQRAARDYLASLSNEGVASILNDGREVIGREAEGRFIPLFMSIGRLPNDSGFCAVVRDLTQWKRAEEELTHARALAERASSQKTDFLARISHEIRTPLNAIIGFSELMMDERFGSIGNERYRDYLRDINRSGSHVLDLVNDLLDISKIEAGEQEMAHEAVSLNETIGQSVAMMQPQANRERVIIRSSLASRLPDVVADLRSVRQIALNLLSNAIRYTQAGGQVIVSTAYEPSGEVVLRIRDTGIGMSQAEIEQALKPFKQINALKRKRGDGTGLGLPLTKAMVEANRARFSINSTPGDGTLVEVSFPATRVLAR